MSYYLDPNKLTDRLRKEWEKYNGLIIAVDYDSTLIPYWEDEKGADFEPIHQLIRECKTYGCTIIINTAALETRHEEIKENLKRLDIPWDCFNITPPHIYLHSKDIGKTGKVYANVYLDDRAGLQQVFATLQLLLLERKYAAACSNVEYLRSSLMEH